MLVVSKGNKTTDEYIKYKKENGHSFVTVFLLAQPSPEKNQNEEQLNCRGKI